MIITRSPLRLPIAGGGTDLPSYYMDRGTSWISFAINKYCFSQIHPRFNEKTLVKYSNIESVSSIQDIQHPLIREALKYVEIKFPVELTFSANLPGSTGLGSSGSFLVSLLSSLYSLKMETKTKNEIAQIATEIEMNILNQPIGLQDQYIAAIGGLIEFEVKPNGFLTWNSLNLDSNKIRYLEDSFLLYFTGITRDSSTILLDQKIQTLEGGSQMLDSLSFVKSQVEPIKNSILKLDLHQLGILFNDHWNRKKARNINMSNSTIDNFYDFALKHGALGGKLVGAGGGGFLLIVTENKNYLRKKMSETNLTEVPFRFDFEGVTTVYRD